MRDWDWEDWFLAVGLLIGAGSLILVLYMAWDERRVDQALATRCRAAGYHDGAMTELGPTCISFHRLSEAVLHPRQ